MKTEDHDRASLPFRVLVFLAFFVFGSFLAIYAGAQLYDFLYQVVGSEAIVVYDRGSIYGFGAGEALLALTFIMFMRGILNRPIGKGLSNLLKFSLFLMLAFITVIPFATDFLLEKHIEKIGYIDCREATYHGTLSIYATRYYTDNDRTCLELVKKHQRRRDQPLSELF